MTTYPYYLIEFLHLVICTESCDKCFRMFMRSRKIELVLFTFDKELNQKQFIFLHKINYENPFATFYSSILDILKSFVIKACQEDRFA